MVSEGCMANEGGDKPGRPENTPAGTTSRGANAIVCDGIITQTRRERERAAPAASGQKRASARYHIHGYAIAISAASRG